MDLLAEEALCLSVAAPVWAAAAVCWFGLVWACCARRARRKQQVHPGMAELPALAGVKHPGLPDGIVQEVIVIDLILDRTPIPHLEA